MRGFGVATFLGTIFLVTAQLANAQYNWTPPVPIDTSSSGGQLGGYMALDDSGNIYVTWAGYTPSGTQQSVVIQRSTNQGLTWIRTDYAPGSDLARTPQDIEIDHTGTVWLLWYSLANEFAPTYLNLSKSTDNGQTFATVFRSRAYANGFMDPKLAVDGDNSIYLLWDDVQFKLTKFRRGDISQRTDALVPNDTLRVDYQPDLAVSRDFVVHCVWEGFFYDPNTGYHEFVFYSRSTDSGATFHGRTRVDTVDAVGTSYVHHYPAVAADSNGNVFVSYTRELVVNQSDIRFTRSTDGGLSFVSPLIVSDNESYKSVLCVDSPEAKVNILLTRSTGALHKRSTDGGITFGQSSLVGSIAPRSLRAARNGFLFASGERGFYAHFTKTNVLVGVPFVVEVPGKFELFQNYPNPFNSSTTLRFTVGKPELIDIRIFNVVGQEVSVVVSERLETGTYSTKWDANNLSSGVYFVRMETARGYVATKKMILLR